MTIPEVQQPTPKKKQGILSPLLVLVAALAFVIPMGIYQFNRMGAERAPSAEDLRINAQQACEGAVGQNLKAPSTARYNSTASGSGPWVVTGTVDAQNSFGAILRNTYSCSVTYDETTRKVNATLDHLE